MTTDKTRISGIIKAERQISKNSLAHTVRREQSLHTDYTAKGRRTVSHRLYSLSHQKVERALLSLLQMIDHCLGGLFVITFQQPLGDLYVLFLNIL